MTNHNSPLLAHLSHHFASRIELGAAFWSINPSSGLMRFYDYEETISIAFLIHTGWSIEEAASAVYAELVCATLRCSCCPSSPIQGRDFIYNLGAARLTDGSIWDIAGDQDLNCKDEIIKDLGLQIGATAIRNLQPSTEPLVRRIYDLMKIGKLDPEGHFAPDRVDAVRL